MLQRTTGLTIADLDAIPEEIKRHELYDGVLVVTAAPAYGHAAVVARLTAALVGWADTTGHQVAAGAGVLLDPRNYLEPDLVVLAPDHAVTAETKYLERPPVLVVEVASPSTRRRDLGAKKERYERWGVPEYWFVEHRQERVTVHRLVEGRYEVTMLGPHDPLSAPVLPGFAVAVEKIVRVPGQ